VRKARLKGNAGYRGVTVDQQARTRAIKPVAPKIAADRGAKSGSKQGLCGPLAMLADNSSGKQIGMAYVEQYFQPRGGPARMRTLPEQDLARELPIAGMTPRR
jgi:hypothetical protein